MEPVSRAECERVHTDLNGTLKELHDDVVMIRDNHLPHIDIKLDGIKESSDKKIQGVSDKLDRLQLALVIVGILAGINVLGIFLQYLGV